jgi:hypothetical protein
VSTSTEWKLRVNRNYIDSHKNNVEKYPLNHVARIAKANKESYEAMSKKILGVHADINNKTAELVKHLDRHRITGNAKEEVIKTDGSIQALYSKLYEIIALTERRLGMFKASSEVLIEKEMAMRGNLNKDLEKLLMYQEYAQLLAKNDHILHRDVYDKRIKAIDLMIKNKGEITLKSHHISSAVHNELKRIKGDKSLVNYCYGSQIQHALVNEVHTVLRHTQKTCNCLKNDSSLHIINDAAAHYAYQAADFIVEGTISDALDHLDYAWAFNGYAQSVCQLKDITRSKLTEASLFMASLFADRVHLDSLVQLNDQSMGWNERVRNIVNILSNSSGAKNNSYDVIKNVAQQALQELEKLSLNEKIGQIFERFDRQEEISQQELQTAVTEAPHTILLLAVERVLNTGEMLVAGNAKLSLKDVLRNMYAHFNDLKNIIMVPSLA